MALTDVYNAIQEITENVLFAPFNWMRATEVESWGLANFMNWIFFAILIVAFAYWMKQLKGFNDNNEEDRTSTSHSFLGGDKYHDGY
ncbi:MAG: putative membrane protein [Planctomycetota bacterium]|jgi:uncharacterized membrane protein|uniref:DUF6341 family protein n=1 Tax=Patiriisocius sp. Uisw_047 TaxID=3230969 RepID=UPI0039EA2DC1